MQKFLNRVIKTSIYLLIFLIPLFWLPFSFETFEFNKQYLLFGLTTIAFFAWMARMILVEKELKFKFSLMDIPVAAFLLTAILSAVFSVDKTSSIFGFYGRFSDGLISLFCLVALYFLITNNTESSLPANSNKGRGAAIFNQEGLVKALLCSAFVAVLTAYFSAFGLWAKINDAIGGKLPPITQSPVFNSVSGSFESFALWLSIIVVFLVGVLLSGEGGRLKKALYWLLFLSSLSLLTIIDFHIVWILLILTMIPLLFFSLVKRIFSDDVNWLLVPIFLIILSTVFIVSNASDLKSKIFASQSPKELVLSQGQSWLVGLKGATENIKSGFLGSGVGNWHYDFAKFKSASFNQTLLWNARMDRAGGYFPEILGTMGFLGFLSYFSLLALIFFRYYILLFRIAPRQTFASKEKEKIQKPAGSDIKPQLPLLAVIFALIVGQLVFYQTTVLAFTFWFFLGLWTAAGQKGIREKSLSFKNFPELSLVFSVFLIIVGLAILLIYFMAVKFYIADVNFRNGVVAADAQKMENAVRLNPFQAQYKIVLARFYLNQVQLEVQKPEAERDVNAISVNIYKAIAFAKAGQIGNFVISGATESAPNRVASWETLGMIYRDVRGLVTGTTDWAINSFEQAIKLEPVNPTLYTEVGKLHLVLGNTEKAKEAFNKAKSLKPDYPESILRLSLIYEQEKNLDEAIRQMEGLDNLYPYNAEVLFQLGRLYFNAKRTDDAIAQLEKAGQLAPNYSNIFYALGMAYQQKGRENLAINAFERVLELNPDNADVKARLEDLRKPAKEEEEK